MEPDCEGVALHHGLCLTHHIEQRGWQVEKCKKNCFSCSHQHPNTRGQLVAILRGLIREKQKSQPVKLPTPPKPPCFLDILHPNLLPLTTRAISKQFEFCFGPRLEYCELQPRLEYYGLQPRLEHRIIFNVCADLLEKWKETNKS